jgi:glucose/arabinose dehydrogenase
MTEQPPATSRWHTCTRKRRNEERALLSRLLLRLLAIFCIVSVARNLEAQTYRVDTLARAPLAQYPVCLAFPQRGDGVFFFTEKNSGRVRLVAGPSLQTRPFVTIPVETEGAQGLLGITLHPSYPDTPFVFVFYVRAGDRLGIVERYRDSSGVGVDPTTIAIIPRRDAATENNGGILRFGADGKLYVTVGDHQTHPELAQDTSSRHLPWGKILRLNPDGSYPVDNPSPLKPFWAIGLRNSQGLTVDAETGDIYCSDGGTEEINALYRVRGGSNFGWPFVMGASARRLTQPLYAFPPEHPPDLTGLVIYRGNGFPRLRGKLLVTANAIPGIWVGTFIGGGDSLRMEKIFAYPSGFADLQVGPDGSLYLTNGPYLSSKILRISPVAPEFTNTPPPDAVQGVRFTYTPTFSGTPPDVTLLSGPDGMTLESETGTVRWIPSNAQSLSQQQRFTLRARNGAATITRESTIKVVNVNDPPTRFQLVMPGSGRVIGFFGHDPELLLRWERSVDPDGDSIHYVVDVDTSAAFASPSLRTVDTGTVDSLRILLPRIAQEYFWRVTATDGRYTTLSTPPVSSFAVAVTAPVPAPMKPAREISPTPPPQQVVVAPLNPSTSLTYTLAKGGQVRIAVFNILGQEILRVFDGTQPQGAYTVDLAKLNLPDGMYFYRLQAPGIFETKKVILAR